jgi:error-prone DNA polymerase
MCANVITFRGKSASRETGKAFGLARETLNHLSGMVGSFEWKGPNDTLKVEFRHLRNGQYWAVGVMNRQMGS